MLPKKKIFLIIAVVVILIVAGVGFQKYEQQRKTKELAVKAKCPEDTGKLSDGQLVEKVISLSALSAEENPLREAQRKTTFSYLICNFNISDKSEEIFQETKTLWQKLNPIHKTFLESFVNGYSNLGEKDKVAAAKYSFLGMLATGNLTEVCPNKLPDTCTKVATDRWQSSDADYYPKALNWCKKLCDLIPQYSENKDKLEEEILNFKEWSSNLSKRESQYRRRIPLAYRFGGKETALKICDNLPDIAGKEECAKEADDLILNIEKFKTRKEQCLSYRQEVENLVCSVPK